MADSPTTVIWRDIPVGSVLRLQSDGSLDDYELPVIIELNGKAHPGLEASDLNPGPATIDITEVKQRWDLAPSIIVSTTLSKGITFKASIVDTNGKVVNVKDAGKTVPAEAEWHSGKTAGSLREVTILVRSVAS